MMRYVNLRFTYLRIGLNMQQYCLSPMQNVFFNVRYPQTLNILIISETDVTALF